MAEKINELIRDYQAGKLTRREFVRRAIMLTGSLAAANALLTHFFRSTAAAQVAASDPAVLWHAVINAYERSPHTNVDGMKRLHKLMTQINPKIADVRVENAIDNSFMNKLETSGFIQSVSKKN